MPSLVLFTVRKLDRVHWKDLKCVVVVVVIVVVAVSTT